mmetsp:Transcript_2601/g.4419  ORF Transcript_2601/g.4419 Transcript_2601/m.4419 type:complete len:200 (-) Transcript_2601:298-897(-)
MAAAALAKSATWKERLQQSLKKNASLAYAKYVQLATVKEDGRPANRTVVFRGFLGNTEDLTFITDMRSNKVQEVAGNPACEVAWYFPTSREQYRLSGQLTIVGPQHADAALLKARQTAWNNLSASGRSQFAWPQPGLPRDVDSEEYAEGAADPPQEPLPAFALVVMHVDEVDVLLLRGNTRTTYSRKDGEWQEGHNVNP